MVPFKRDIPYRALAVIAALALVASIVDGRERPDGVTPNGAAVPTAPEEALERMDFNGLRAARALDAPAERPVLTASISQAAAVASPGPDISLPAQQREPARPAAPREPPPLPFIYLGQMVDQGKTTVFVGRGDDHYDVAPGLVIDDTYKVERVTETQVTFVYVPLGARQVLAVPSLKAID